MASLAEVLPDDELIEVIDSASSMDDPVSFFRAKLAAARPSSELPRCEPDNESPLAVIMNRYGMEIVESSQMAYNKKTRERVAMVDGYLIRKSDSNGNMLYAGPTLCFVAMSQCARFKTRKEAEHGVIVYDRIVSEQAERVMSVGKLSHVEVRLPIESDTTVEAGGYIRRITLMMNRDQHAKMRSMYNALRAENAEWEKGKPVVSFPDVIRYILSKVDIPKAQ